MQFMTPLPCLRLTHAVDDAIAVLVHLCQHQTRLVRRQILTQFLQQAGHSVRVMMTHASKRLLVETYRHTAEHCAVSRFVMVLINK